MKMNKGMFKKIGMIALTALFTVSIAACKPQEHGDSSATPAPASHAPISGDIAKITPDPNSTSAPAHNLSRYSYQFVRIPYSAAANSVEPVVVTGAKQLRELVNERTASGMTSKTDAEDYLKQYDDEFFKSSYVLVFNLTFSSGSVVPKVTGVDVENGVVTVTTEGTMDGDVGTADMASHMCLLSLNAEKFPETSTFKIMGAGTAQGTDTKKI
jgi:hypothetical protein